MPPEVIARPESDSDHNPTARYDKPDECPDTNVSAHGRYPLVELYPALTWYASPTVLDGSRYQRRPSTCGYATSFLESVGLPETPYLRRDSESSLWSGNSRLCDS